MPFITESFDFGLRKSFMSRFLHECEFLEIVIYGMQNGFILKIAYCKCTFVIYADVQSTIYRFARPYLRTEKWALRSLGRPNLQKVPETLLPGARLRAFSKLFLDLASFF